MITKIEAIKELNKQACEYCNKPAIGIIRCRYVCGQCFNLIQKDNIRKNNLNEEITDSDIISRPCGWYNCNKYILSKLEYVNNELTTIYCSIECENKDKLSKDKKP